MMLGGEAFLIKNLMEVDDEFGPGHYVTERKGLLLNLVCSLLLG